MEKLYQSFVWQDRFLVGHREIDDDHRRFFAYFSDQDGRRQKPLDSAGSEALFLAIVEDLRRHVIAEERILEELGFPGLGEHRNCHLALWEQVRATKAIGAKGGWGSALRLLSTHILEHVVIEDAVFRPYLLALNAADATAA